MILQRQSRRRSGSFAAVLLAIFGLALGVGALLPTRAQPEPVAFDLVFLDLAPGTAQTESASFPLSRDADLVGLTWIERTGVMTEVELTAQVCSASGACTAAFDPMDPVPFPAGATTVTVTATLAAPVNATEGSVVGQLTFVAEDELALTGADPWQLIAWCVAAVAVGLFIVAARPRRRRSA